jgi:hypothetical protein
MYGSASSVNWFHSPLEGAPAQRAPSMDAKSYLADAHSRVMSVAALRRQFAQPPIGDLAASGKVNPS